MSSKKWFVMFLGTLVLIVMLIAGLNLAVDPFGVFGDRFFNWYSYDFTNNPRAAKIAYLDEHHGEYDSYIIGCSLTSSYPVETLNRYYHANFYNLIMYGSDMYDIENTVRYVLENYGTKNIIINMGFTDAIKYNHESHPLTHALHYQVDGSSPLRFYSKYLLASPRYTVSKIMDYWKDTYLPQTFDVFDVKTGAYDKSARDVEGIGDMSAYLKRNPTFNRQQLPQLKLESEQQCLDSIAQIKEMCAEKGATFTLIISPMYQAVLDEYAPEDIARLLTRLSKITGFWDFFKSSLSLDSRYFYDVYHFRNAVGEMALHRMFSNQEIYYPKDFGFYVTEENAAEHVEKFTHNVTVAGKKSTTTTIAEGINALENTARVPILMYHHIGKDSSVTAEKFERQIKALADAGYQTVTFNQLSDFVHHGTQLPEKPVVITFDDGYLSNYEIAWPVLEKHGMKGTIFVIGISVGKDTYKDTDKPITPHFTYEQAREMEESGVISIQTHAFDGHEVEGLDKAPLRVGILQKEGESEEEYIAYLRSDFEKAREGIETNVGNRVTVFSYPYGKYSVLSNVILKEMGITCTVTSDAHVNTLIKGLPQSLINLGRFTVSGEKTPEELLEMMKEQ